jgi:hypothetical protein
LLGACVSSPKLKTPCEVTMRVVLMTPEHVHARCAPGPGESVVSDEGVLMRHTDAAVYGGVRVPGGKPSDDCDAGQLRGSVSRTEAHLGSPLRSEIDRQYP